MWDLEEVLLSRLESAELLPQENIILERREFSLLPFPEFFPEFLPEFLPLVLPGESINCGVPKFDS